MKGTENFKRVIATYLEYRAEIDELFAERFYNPRKNIDECIIYILNWVKESGCNGFDDDEIYSQAMHYYDEDSIDVGKPLSCSIVVNHLVELTEEEKEQARKDAIKRIENEHYKRMTKVAQKPKRQEVITDDAPSLFELF